MLGAGGIRGCAHAAVIAALREAGIPIDVVVGASVGSMFGLAVAAGLPTDHIVRSVESSTSFDIFRFYAGRLRINGRNPISRLLLEAGEGKDFSDLPVPFAVIGTDMATGQPTVLDRGPVLPAVQASIALPFIARPVSLDGRMYVDGGLFETSPIAAARNMGADRIIAVCLGGNYLAPSFLRRRPWTKRMLERVGRQPNRPARPGLGDQLRFGLRLYAACYDPPPVAQDADVCIWPEFGRIGPNSMVGAQFCFQQGLQAVREAIPEIEKIVMSYES